MNDEELAEIEERWSKASSGAWIWEVNPKYHTVSLRSRGGLVVMDFVRWGMGSAAPRFLDENHLLHRVDKLMEPIPGREHHSHWAQQVNHPDAMAIAAAPQDVAFLIAEVRRQRAENRALQSRLDIADGRVDGMREENGSISVQRLRQLHKNAGGYYDTNFGL